MSFFSALTNVRGKNSPNLDDKKGKSQVNKTSLRGANLLRQTSDLCNTASNSQLTVDIDSVSDATPLEYNKAEVEDAVDSRSIQAREIDRKTQYMQAYASKKRVNYAYMACNRMRSLPGRHGGSVPRNLNTGSRNSILQNSDRTSISTCISTPISLQYLESGSDIPSFENLNPHAEVPTLNSASFRFVGQSRTSIAESLPVSTDEGLAVGNGEGPASNKDVLDAIWQPVSGLVHSKESNAFKTSLAQLMQQASQKISAEELESRVHTPQYKVGHDEWADHVSHNMYPVKALEAVARLPASLIVYSTANLTTVSDEVLVKQTKCTQNKPQMRGYLRKRGGTNKSLKRRYMLICGSSLSYYKKKPDLEAKNDKRQAYLRGSINLEEVSSLHPVELKGLKYGIALVTASRTWELAADNEAEYSEWLRVMCNVVKYNAVHVAYKEMFKLQEVSAEEINDIRLQIPLKDTVGQAVERIFASYQNASNAPQLKPFDPSDFALKVTGFRDFLLDQDSPMTDYMRVRECLITKKTIQFSVIPRSDVQVPTEFLQPSKLDHETTEPDACLETATQKRYKRMMDRIKEVSSIEDSAQDILKSEELHAPLSLRISRILNIPRSVSILKRTSEHCEVEQKMLNASKIFVLVELYSGGKLLHKGSLETSAVRLRKQKNGLLFAEWPEGNWLHFETKISALPKTVRVMLTAFGIKDESPSLTTSSTANSPLVSGNEGYTEELETMLITGVNLFAKDGSLTQGTQYVAMYNNLHTCKVGPVPHIVMPEEPFLHLKFSSFPIDVKFCWTLQSAVPLSKSSICIASPASKSARERLATLHKEGWLQKLGCSRWTRWRRRWFVLDQDTCTLSYSDDRMALQKKISLQNCTVAAADDMNEKYTTAPVNKGTRKERQTYCFRIRPANSARDYVISTETKQERSEWMLAILTVSQLKNPSLEAPDEKFFATFNESDSDKLTHTIDAKQENLIILHSNSAENVTAKPSKLSRSKSEEISMTTKRNFQMQSARYDSSATEGSIYPFSNQNSVVSELRRIILLDPLYRLNPLQKTQLWNHREEFMDLPAALPRVLRCVNWGDKLEIKKAITLLPRWAAPLHKISYIDLLDGEYDHEDVRGFAVSKIAELSDTALCYFIPQLVQAIKFENYHDSALAKLLVARALRNPNQIGFELYWAMKVESHHVQYRERYGVLLNEYLRMCSQKMRAILQLQDRVFGADGLLDQICQQIKSRKKDGADEMKRVMLEQLAVLNETLPDSFQLPIDPRIAVGKIILSKCRVMDSAKKPLWLVFENAEAGGDSIAVIFKSGDDIRQDCLTLQLIRLMDEIWRGEGLDLAMEPYRCVATSPMTGVLQVVPDSVTTAEIHKRVGILGAFRDPSFSSWIQANNPDPTSHRDAIDLFRRSCAGYCVATCVLGIGDRHNDNIMISSSGRYFHIDFGHFLGHFKYQLGMKRERTPFVFTKEMAHVLGGTESQEFKDFVDTSCTAYCVLRKHVHLLVTLLLLMVPADMPELTGRDDINHLVATLAPELEDKSARESFAHAINFCLDDKFKRIDNTIHILAHLLS